MSSPRLAERGSEEPGGDGPDLAVHLPAACDALLIVPPFAALSGAYLGVHVLQACAREAGLTVGILYANMHFAARIGEESYGAVAGMPGAFLGERLFATAAYGAPPFGSGEAEQFRADRFDHIASNAKTRHAAEIAAFLSEIHASEDPTRAVDLVRIAEEAGPWVDEIARAVASRGYKVVGCTTMFSQTASSVALLDRVKVLRPETLTILGGPNCEGEMAEGIASIGAKVDAIFSGESEATFTRFLEAVLGGERPPGPILRGGILRDMESLPPPDLAEYFESRRRWLGAGEDGSSDEDGSSEVEIPYETSRGCSWGERRPCRFCGYNGTRMPYRSKSPGKVVRELGRIVEGRATRRVRLADSAVPTEYYTSLFRRLADEVPAIDLHCFLRPTATLEDVLAMRDGGVSRVQVGLEGLSTSLLKRMGKGFTVRHNLAFLRYARVAGFVVFWNLLCGFPGDERSEYEATLDLMRRLHHLAPPSGFSLLNLSRFSAYFENPREHGITNLRPRSGYERFLPPGADAWKIDYRFAGDYESGFFESPRIVADVYREFRAWRTRWAGSALRPFGSVPTLKVHKEGNDRYRIVDSRDLPGSEPEALIDRPRAKIALVARPFEDTQEAEWALGREVAVRRDGWLVPLATASEEVLLEFEREASASREEG